jgi:hypothetical protein
MKVTGYGPRTFPIFFFAGFLIYLVSTSAIYCQMTFSRKLIFNCTDSKNIGFYTSLPQKIQCSENAEISLLENIRGIEIQTSSSDSPVKSPWTPINCSLTVFTTGNRLRIRSTTQRTVPLLLTFMSEEDMDYHRDDFSKVDIIERKEWGAQQPRNDYSEHLIDSIIIHHSWSPDQKSYREAESISGIQRFHMDGNGWDDIGYHYLIGPDGLIFRGRPEEVVGAHCVPNSGKVGICLLGNYDPDFDPLPEKGWDSLKKLTIALSSKYDIPPDMLFGHRDFSPKSCPGETVYRAFPELKAGMPFSSEYRGNDSEYLDSLEYFAADEDALDNLNDRSNRGD